MLSVLSMWSICNIPTFFSKSPSMTYEISVVETRNIYLPLSHTHTNTKSMFRMGTIMRFYIVCVYRGVPGGKVNIL
jgi:hypothetical protein